MSSVLIAEKKAGARLALRLSVGFCALAKIAWIAALAGSVGEARGELDCGTVDGFTGG